MTNWPTTSKQSRGYGAAWERVRKVVLERDGYLCQCRHCKAEGRTTVANQVDHIVSKAKARARGWSQAQIDDPSNLQAINEDCHKIKGMEERGATPRKRVRVGMDGFPVAY